MSLLDIIAIIFVVCMILLLILLCWILCAIQKKYEEITYNKDERKKDDQK